MHPTDDNDDDVFQESTTPTIVDCDVLEAAKENVQPLGTGRRVTALSAILATPHAQREAKLSATRNRLRINVEIALAADDEDEEEDTDTDALDAYWAFVNWTLDNYPQGHSAESGLLELLEEATRVLKDHAGGKWRGDVKYLKLWLLYASYVEKPVVIYKFLIANEIGTGFALLYEEYAAVLERDGRRKEADDAYSLGIARHAAPLARLQERYNDFQKRMMSNMMLPPAPPSSSTTSSQKSRPALTTTSLKPSTSSSRSSTSASTSRTSTSSSSLRSVSTPLPMTSSSSNTRLQIFVDPTGTDSQPGENAPDSWQDLGTRKTRVKENVPEVKKLAGTTLKQAGKSKRIASTSSTSGAGGTSRIAVYRDPGPGDMAPPPIVPVTGPVGTAKKQGIGIGIGIGVPPKTPARSASFAPFVDAGAGDDAGGSPVALPPATPKFTPFRDETAVAAVASPVNALGTMDSVIKVKKAGLKAPTPSSEAEALRKDPLKNYREVLTVVGDDS
ncbi:hypothetical protein P691DRAFT_738410 [Macrolepiota fuliginosa MF-IS2]|uniref:BUB1 N-terminal domain-containing protein n=1 Tax=Macrolepiota fuliginosa MF-IS2 TaxID=1400762 RepID=A0A9P6BXF5_9AGAR|nr:hypothetical protein P691DRAFT_738410 [Macrolepiota fuliginosa MF-IS2]